MFAMVIKRCLGTLPLLLLITLFPFALIKAVPGDPVDVLLGSAERDLAPQQVALLRQEMGLDQPLYKQYLGWLSGWWGKGELGRSYRDGRPVAEVIAERCPATLALVGAALVVAFAGGIAWGLAMVLLEGLERWRSLGHLLGSLALVIYAAPGFWLASLALFSLCRLVPGMPVSGLHAPGEPITLPGLCAHLVLPALMLASRRCAKVALFLRAVMIEELGKDYVIVARAKGLSALKVLVDHVFRNSLLPVISLLGLSLPALLGGSVLIETVFAWPGMGRLAVDATFGRNYPLLLGLVTVYGSLVIVSTLLADLLYAVADPRLGEDGRDRLQANQAQGGRA